MILIGQHDSPIVRRVAIAITLYDVDFRHRPSSVFSDADAIRAFNPLIRVPTLVHSDGRMLPNTISILAWLAEQMEPDRHAARLEDDPVFRRISQPFIAPGVGD